MEAGRNLDDELDLVQLDPMTRLKWGETSLDTTSDSNRMAEEIERLEQHESRFRAAQKANRIAHRMDVEAQIAAHQHEKKLEKMRAEEERKAFRNAEAEYGSMMEKDKKLGIPTRNFGIKSTKWYT